MANLDKVSKRSYTLFRVSADGALPSPRILLRCARNSWTLPPPTSASLRPSIHIGNLPAKFPRRPLIPMTLLLDLICVSATVSSAVVELSAGTCSRQRGVAYDTAPTVARQ